MNNESGERMAGQKGSERTSVGKQRRNSVILAVFLIAVFLVFYMIQRFQTKEDSLKAVIQIDGKTVHTMDLDRDETYTAGDPEGDYNTIVVKDGTVMVEESNCANQVCVKTGQIRNEGEVIACLPHKMIIYLE